MSPASTDKAPVKATVDQGKSPEAFRTIGEVSKALSIQPHVLRYWEEQFPMLRPVKRAGGRRLYRPEDIELVATIDRLVHREGFTLRGARKWLQSRGKVGQSKTTAPELAEPTAAILAEPVAPEPLPAEPTPRHDPQLLADLRALRAQLSEALALA